MKKNPLAAAQLVGAVRPVDEEIVQELEKLRDTCPYRDVRVAANEALYRIRSKAKDIN